MLPDAQPACVQPCHTQCSTCLGADGAGDGRVEHPAQPRGGPLHRLHLEVGQDLDIWRVRGPAGGLVEVRLMSMSAGQQPGPCSEQPGEARAAARPVQQPPSSTWQPHPHALASHAPTSAGGTPPQSPAAGAGQREGGRKRAFSQRVPGSQPRALMPYHDHPVNHTCYSRTPSRCCANPGWPGCCLLLPCFLYEQVALALGQHSHRGLKQHGIAVLLQRQAGR